MQVIHVFHVYMVTIATQQVDDVISAAFPSRKLRCKMDFLHVWRQRIDIVISESKYPKNQVHWTKGTENPSLGVIRGGSIKVNSMCECCGNKVFDVG